MSTPVDMRTYTVQVFRDHGFLILEVPELDAAGQARSLATAEGTARELIAMWLDVPADQVLVVMDYTRIDPDALEMAAAARSEQAKADEMTRAAAKQTAGSGSPTGTNQRAQPPGCRRGAGRDLQSRAATTQGRTYSWALNQVEGPYCCAALRVPHPSF